MDAPPRAPLPGRRLDGTRESRRRLVHGPCSCSPTHTERKVSLMAKQQQPKTSPTTNETYIQANRTLWDAWTKLHLQPRVYGVEEIKAGRSKLTPIELDELGDVAGTSLLHLQCHFGLDT